MMGGYDYTTTERQRRYRERQRAKRKAETPERHCAHCGALLPADSRSDARYCSSRCRVYATRSRQRQAADD